MSHIRNSVLLGGLLFAVAATPAFAGTDVQMPMGRGMMDDDCPMMDEGMMGRGMMGQGKMMQEHMKPMMEGRLAYLKAELGITDAQSTAWDAYVTVVKSQMTAMQGLREGMMATMQSGTPMQRMEARMTGMQSMLDGMKAIKPATDALYKVLTDAQKTKADRLLGAGC